MKNLLKNFLILILVIPILGFSKMSIYNISAKDIDGNEIKMSKYENRVLLIVNVASKCGFTGQYEGLQTLHEKYSEQGLSILGFPSNQFLGQEPGTEEEIKEFCRINYNIGFDMFSKIDVNGANTHPLYEHLKKEQPGTLGMGAIKWNFTKFLVNEEGQVINRYAPSTTPAEIEKDIKKLLLTEKAL